MKARCVLSKTYMGVMYRCRLGFVVRDGGK